MFTGLIQRLGVVTSIQPSGQGSRVVISASPSFDDLELGESIAVDGACLTVTEFTTDSFSVDVSPESLRRTSIGGKRPGHPVNLERALRLSDRLGGHLVTGHIDGLGRIVELRKEGEFVTVGVEIPEALTGQVVEKGSIAIDGISLTVAKLVGHKVSMAVIPLTLKETTLGKRSVGDSVNVETDLLAKYVEKAISNSGRSGGTMMDRLREYGFTD